MDGLSTRCSVSEGLKREEGVKRSLQRGVGRSLQEEKVGFVGSLYGSRRRSDHDYCMQQYWRIRLMSEWKMDDTLSEGKHTTNNRVLIMDHTFFSFSTGFLLKKSSLSRPGILCCCEKRSSKKKKKNSWCGWLTKRYIVYSTFIALLVSLSIQQWQYYVAQASRTWHEFLIKINVEAKRNVSF